jgi:hypothetical protein
VQTVLLLCITLRTNWDKEVSKITRYSSTRSYLFFFPLLSELIGWPIIYIVALVGFEGEGQSFQFFLTRRPGDMRHARCTIF